jgi:hypothetical protein
LLIYLLPPAIYQRCSHIIPTFSTYYAVGNFIAREAFLPFSKAFFCTQERRQGEAFDLLLKYQMFFFVRRTRDLIKYIAPRDNSLSLIMLLQYQHESRMTKNSGGATAKSFRWYSLFSFSKRLLPVSAVYKRAKKYNNAILEKLIFHELAQ